MQGVKSVIKAPNKRSCDFALIGRICIPAETTFYSTDDAMRFIFIRYWIANLRFILGMLF